MLLSKKNNKGENCCTLPLYHQNFPITCFSLLFVGRFRHEAIFKHMQEIVAGDDPAVRNGKPAPDIYLEAARRLNVDPRDCLVFEDALSGVQSGKAAGCTTVAIPDQRFTEEEKSTFRDQGDVVLGTLWDFDGSEFGVAVNMATYRCLGLETV
jgi:hypothetical protein